MKVPEIGPKEAKERLERDDRTLLLDVREPSEAKICSIPGAVLIPLGSLTERLEEIPKDKEIIVHCKGGGRSARATEFLLARGYPSVKNLAGGILRWIDEIDPSLKKY